MNVIYPPGETEHTYIYTYTRTRTVVEIQMSCTTHITKNSLSYTDILLFLFLIVRIE